MSNVQGLDALMRRMKAIGEPQPVLRALQLSTIQEAQALAPRRSGFLQRNILPGAVTNDYAIVKVDVPYARAIEYGGKEYDIFPKKGKVLAWATTSAGRRLSGRTRSGVKRSSTGLGGSGLNGSGGIRLAGVGVNSGALQFAPHVHHPKTKAQPYLIPGAKKATSNMGNVIVEQWNRAA